MNNKLKVLDLFSGIGGFSLGLHSTGIFDTIKFVEFDKYCQKVLKKNFPNIPIEGDIRNVKGIEFEEMSLLEDSHANHSALQENKKEQTTTAISGQKCLDSLKKLNQNSLLGRMCKELLTSKTAWYSDRCSTTWKVKVSKSNVSLFQFRASVLGTKGTEHGLLATPNTMDYLPPRSAEGQKINGGTSEGQNQTIESERTSGSRNNGNVSNSISELARKVGNNRREWRTVEDKIWRFCTEKEEQTEHDIRSQTIGRNVIPEETPLKENDSKMYFHTPEGRDRITRTHH